MQPLHLKTLCWDADTRGEAIVTRVAKFVWIYSKLYVGWQIASVVVAVSLSLYMSVCRSVCLSLSFPLSHEHTLLSIYNNTYVLFVVDRKPISFYLAFNWFQLSWFHLFLFNVKSITHSFRRYSHADEWNSWKAIGDVYFVECTYIIYIYIGYYAYINGHTHIYKAGFMPRDGPRISTSPLKSAHWVNSRPQSSPSRTAHAIHKSFAITIGNNSWCSFIFFKLI